MLRVQAEQETQQRESGGAGQVSVRTEMKARQPVLRGLMTTPDGAIVSKVIVSQW